MVYHTIGPDFSGNDFYGRGDSLERKKKLCLRNFELPEGRLFVRMGSFGKCTLLFLKGGGR
jgi:hypothetical protein